MTIHHAILTCAKQVADYIDVHFVACVPSVSVGFSARRPANLQNMQIWRLWKKAQKNLEIRTSNLEISKICVKWK